MAQAAPFEILGRHPIEDFRRSISFPNTADSATGSDREHRDSSRQARDGSAAPFAFHESLMSRY
jgi:hypothetical protein